MRYGENMQQKRLHGEGFTVAFSDREVTAWGGLVLLKRMLDTMGFQNAVLTWNLPQPGSNRGYAPQQLVEQFIVAIWCGASLKLVYNLPGLDSYWKLSDSPSHAEPTHMDQHQCKTCFPTSNGTG